MPKKETTPEYDAVVGQVGYDPLTMKSPASEALISADRKYNASMRKLRQLARHARQPKTP